jgi:hypothetical protein
MSVAVENLTRPLTANDRCDRCGAGAQMVARKQDQVNIELFFCYHHANEYRDGLTDKNFYLDTETTEERY